jgi:hypothetical protein
VTPEERAQAIAELLDPLVPEGGILEHGFIAFTYLDEDGKSKFWLYPVGQPRVEQTVGLLGIAMYSTMADAGFSSMEGDN